jgi:extracellular factor (EF) 3-hydroxypalmitic acid methyl ester biosynthesis protein
MENRERSLRHAKDAEALERPGAAPMPPPSAPRRSLRLTPLPATSASVARERPALPTANANGTVRQYEELEGGEGRAVFFRPHRYTAADLAPLRCTVRVVDHGIERECALRDVSQNGVAFAWPATGLVALQQRVEIAVRFDRHEAFRGEARVGSMRQEDGSTIVGVSFDDFLLDVDEVLQLRRVQAWRAEGTSPRARARPWWLPGCERFKSLVAEMRLFFEDSQRELADLEAQLPWHVLHGPDNAARAALVAELRREFVAESVRLSEDIDSAVRQLPDGHSSGEAKAWSIRHVHDFLMQSPGCHRARYKPFGYPGDYELMNFIYGDHFVGPTLFARAVQLAFAQTRAPTAVRSRKDLVKRELKALLSAGASSGRPVRVLSIAAGPAQELSDLFDEVPELPVPLEIVLFEQDKNALAHAWRRVQSKVSRFGGQVRMTFLHDSIKRLLRDDRLFEPFGTFDLVYTCGLYDYLQDRAAAILTRRLALSTAPGGRLLIANMVDHPSRWLMEFHLDWMLVYRTHEELLEIGRRAVPGASVRILEEESLANPFLELTRS